LVECADAAAIHHGDVRAVEDLACDDVVLQDLGELACGEIGEVSPDPLEGGVTWYEDGKIWSVVDCLDQAGVLECTYG